MSTPLEQIAAAVADASSVDLHAPAGLDRLPSVPGRLPAGISLGPGEIHVHLTVRTAAVGDVTKKLGRAVRHAVAGTDRAGDTIHLHLDRFEP